MAHSYLKPGQRSQRHLENLGDAMKQLGWERKQLRIGEGNRSYHYVRGKEPYKQINVYGSDRGNPAHADYEKE